MSIKTDSQALRPPRSNVGIVGWCSANLFSSWFNAILTVAALLALLLIVPPILSWTIFDASWAGSTPADCVGGGACWVFIKTRLSFFVYGFFPADGYWRVNILYLMLAIIVAALALPGVPFKRQIGLFALTGFPLLALVLMRGGLFGLAPVETDKWGGLSLTLILAFVGILGSLPFGILLALGRRSKMPVIRALCIAFIELWRGVPLISVLFMASVMLPLFLPDGITFNKLLRALIGITMFQSAYMAEVVRGGLQAIPRGQYEAAEALGLGYWKSMRLIVLPQALRLVIPGIVNTFIALFKDTTLVLIIGMFDILGAVKSTIADSSWGNVAAEGYLFAALCFWIFCFGMSRYSQNLERKLDTEHSA